MFHMLLIPSEKWWARGRGVRRKGNYILKVQTQVSIYCRDIQFLAFKSSG